MNTLIALTDHSRRVDTKNEMCASKDVEKNENEKDSSCEHAVIIGSRYVYHQLGRSICACSHGVCPLSAAINPCALII